MNSSKYRALPNPLLTIVCLGVAMLFGIAIPVQAGPLTGPSGAPGGTLAFPNTGPSNIKIYDDGVLVTSGISYTGSGSAGNWTLTVTGSSTNYNFTSVIGTSNQPGDTTFGATIGTSETNVTQKTTGPHTFELVLSDKGFTAPIGAGLTLSSSGAVTYSVGNTPTSTSDRTTLQSYASASNVLFATDATSGPQLSAATGNLNTSVAFTPNPAKGPFSAAVNYSMTSDTVLTLNELNARVTIQTTTTVATPEPTSMALLGIGAIGMAGYGWRRRRLAVESKQEELAPAV